MDSDIPNFSFAPIAYVHSPFKEKFGIPRQSMMLKHAKGIIKFQLDPRFRRALEELQSFSHIWLIFVFHGEVGKDWRASVMPPRPETTDQVGALSSRSPNRPNPIGISAVKLESIQFDIKDGIEMTVSGIDLLDGTPILDVKPYLPYADSITDASSGWADQKIKRYKVEFSDESLGTLKELKNSQPEAKELLQEIIELDPRPTSQRREFPIGNDKSLGRLFGFNFLNYDVKCRLTNEGIFVIRMIELPH